MNPFIDIYPKIDVHGYTRDAVNIIIEDFINDNIKLGNAKIVIVHGIGKGILKNEIHPYLRKHKKVKSFTLDFFNVGATIVDLVITK